MFGGIGGFGSGLERASERFECVEYIEKDKYAVKSYNAINNTNYDTTDATQLETEQISDHEILCAGFPCQSFSNAGKRKGFEEARGTLFFEIARVARDKRPEILLLENVKGLLSHNGGRTFGRILNTLAELGYDVEWRVLNSKNFGVPQNRRRTFIVGHLNGFEKGSRQVFPLGETEIQDSRELEGERQENAVGITLANTTRYKTANRTPVQKDGLSWALNSVGDQSIVKVGNVNPSGNGMNGKVYHEKGLAPTVSTNKGEGHKIVQIPRGENSGGLHRESPTVSSNSWHENHFLVYDDYNSSIREEHNVTGTVTPNFGADALRNGNKLIDSENLEMRKLTPRECWRLQGFSDGAFEKAKEAGVSNTQLYKQAGNAVTVNVIEAIANKILKVYFGKTDK
jgi:DNA (cytosine-5)-methyltransferase 1